MCLWSQSLHTTLFDGTNGLCNSHRDDGLLWRSCAGDVAPLFCSSVVAPVLEMWLFCGAAQLRLLCWRCGSSVLQLSCGSCAGNVALL